MSARGASIAILAWALWLTEGLGMAWAAEPAHRHEVLAPAAALPGESIYQLSVELTTQNGERTSLAALRGRPALVTMFYTSCDGVCPMLAFTLRRMEAALTAKQREGLQWLMVSFDPQRDTPQALSAFAQLNQIDRLHWQLARTGEASVRELAAVLGIRFRKLPGGAFSHSTVVVLLDGEGRIVAQTSNLTQLDADFMRTLTAMLQ
jgi:protein SCO1/2